MSTTDFETRSLASKAIAALRRGGPLLVLSLAYKRFARNRLITLGRRLTFRPVIHVVGDSHTFLLDGVSPFVTTWLGGATAYNLGKEGSATGSKEKLERALRAVHRRRDVVLLVLGEIDCRIHVYNQHMAGDRTVTMEQIIGTTIERYGAVVSSLKARGYRVVVHCAPAAAREDNIYDKPHYADEETRARIVREFNARLSDWCAANDVEFLDVYPIVTDETGFIAPEMTEDGVHLGRAALPLYRAWARTFDERPVRVEKPGA